MQAVPYLMAAGTAISTVGAVSQGLYQSQVASSNAKLAEQNAMQAASDAAQSAQDKDRAASQDIGQALAVASASGLSLSSGSAFLRTKSQQTLAKQDRQRISDAGGIQVKNFLDQSAQFKADAKSAKTGAAIAGLTGLITIPTSYISGATMVNKYKGIGQGMSYGTGVV